MYRKVRGEGFYKLMGNIFNFLDKRERKKTKLPVLRVSFVKYNINESESGNFIDFWSNISDEVDIQSFIDVKNVNTLKHSEIEKGKFRCDYPNNMLYVDWNGNYKPCRSEFCKHLVIGDIKNMSVVEAWNSRFMESLRSQLGGEGKLNKYCLNCLSSINSNEDYKALV